MKTAITSATAFLLYGIFFLVCLAVAAYRAAKGQPSPFETEED